MSWIAVMGATRGHLVALAAVAGIGLGLAIAAVVAGAGLATLLTQFPQAYTMLRWAGTLYLFYLAWDAWRDADAIMADADGSKQQAFVQGLVSNILNPKAYLFYGAMLPQFLDETKSATSQVALLSAIYVVIATLIHVAIALASGSFANWLATSKQAITVRKTLALLIAAAAIWFFYATRVLT